MGWSAQDRSYNGSLSQEAGGFMIGRVLLFRMRWHESALKQFFAVYFVQRRTSNLNRDMIITGDGKERARP